MTYAHIVSGRGGDTFSLTTDGSVQSFSDSRLKNGNDVAHKAFITIEDNPIRYCVGASTPAQDGLGHKLDVGDVLVLESYYDIQNFSFINDVAGSQAKLQVTVSYS